MNPRCGPEQAWLRILDRLACPRCHRNLRSEDSALVCESCGHGYPVMDKIIDLRLLSGAGHRNVDYWSQHWSSENQQRLAQRFFSFSRKALFAPAVRYFSDRYFPAQGVFVEAGSGTSECSIKIRKSCGKRILVAVDISYPVLQQAHSIMDVRICGDIFRFPFHDSSVDGIWNVGVMEHFTRGQIDQVMAEFHRVLKPGGPVFMLWPGNNSIPQKVLSGIEAIINIPGRREKFRFHPVREISRLDSRKEASIVLERNGFRSLHIDYGFRSFMTFLTLVGTKG